MKKTTYAYLGPQGTYSHQAALHACEIAGDTDQAQLFECNSITEVFEQVDRGRADFGVVPIENSLEGSVNETMDAFVFTTDAHIIREFILDIHHNLIVAPGVDKTTIRTVSSHPQALAQCRRWLTKEIPAATTRATTSTATAVIEVLGQKGKDSEAEAAIGAKLAAELFGGTVIEEQIEDHMGNQTRFVVFSHSNAPRTGQDKTSMALFMRQDRPGTLLMILAELAYAGLNLTKIESRPTKRALGDYMFWLDVDGHMDDLDLKTALDSLRLKLREVKIIGSFPKADTKD